MSRRSKSNPTNSPQENTKPDTARKTKAYASAVRWLVLTGLVLVVGGVGFQLFRDQPEAGVVGDTAETSPPLQAVGHQDTVSNSEPLATLITASNKSDRVVVETQLNPASDDWDTEVIAELAKVQLKHLGRRLAGEDLASVLSTEVAENVTSGQLRPAELMEVFRDGVEEKELLIRRSASNDNDFEFDGREGLSQALDKLAEPFRDASDVHVHIKVIRVDSSGETSETKAYFEADGQTPTGSLQQRATWQCQWQRATNGKLQLISIRASDFEEVIEKGPWLVDCTKSALGKNSSFHEQLLYGLNHWLSRLGRVHGMHVFARTGLAVGDVNGDGRDDVYVCQPGGLPNRLYIQQPDGTAIDSSHDSGVDWLDQTSSALILDLDNDGDQDLVAASSAGLLVMDNDGSGKFKLQTTLATRDIDTQSFTATDFDNDGDLDLYVCIEFANQMSLHGGAGVDFVYHDANDGAPNVLFRNDIKETGKWTFTDVTNEVGLDIDNRRHSLACAWEDYDNDGDQDLYVANDYGQNCLYQNNDGKFKNIALEANVVDSASGMSVSWGDYNHDGWMDLYVANMFSSAGNRITRQEQFKKGVDDELRDIYSRFAKGNTLLENDGQGKFREVTEEAGVEMGRWAWSSLFADLNNDAWDDLLVANGYITTEDTGDL